MHVTRRPRATGALLALVLLLALLGTGVAGRVAAVADASGSLLAGPAAGPEQGLVRDRAGRSLVLAGNTRDQRELPGPAVPGGLALAAAAWTIVAARRTARPAGHSVAASGARAPPPLRQPAS